MGRFLRLALQDGSAAEASLVVNLDWVRYIDEIGPAHCRLVFGPDHSVTIDGDAASAVLNCFDGGEHMPPAEPAMAAQNGEPYKIQVRHSPDEQWRDVGPAGDSHIGLNCARLLASNQCPGFKGAGDLHARLLDASGKTIWMLESS